MEEDQPQEDVAMRADPVVETVTMTLFRTDKMKQLVTDVDQMKIAIEKMAKALEQFVKAMENQSNTMEKMIAHQEHVLELLKSTKEAMMYCKRDTDHSLQRMNEDIHNAFLQIDEHGCTITELYRDKEKQERASKRDTDRTLHRIDGEVHALAMELQETRSNICEIRQEVYGDALGCQGGPPLTLDERTGKYLTPSELKRSNATLEMVMNSHEGVFTKK